MHMHMYVCAHTLKNIYVRVNSLEENCPKIYNHEGDQRTDNNHDDFENIIRTYIIKTTYKPNRRTSPTWTPV